MGKVSRDAVIVRSAAGSKQAIHFGATDRPLFGFYHPPRAAWRDACVVFCNPHGTDQARSERTYRRLAERLAAAGFPCLRFDLFGTGDSGGDEWSPGLVRAWRDDIGVAIEELRSRSGASRVVLVGLRLGATLACVEAAERGDVESLVLWSPCASGPAYVTDTTKLHKVYARIEPHLARAPRPRADGEEALGTFLPRALVDELSHLDLGDVTRKPARRTLVIDGGGFPEKDALVERLRGLGAEPELRAYPGHKFLVTVPHRALLPENVIESIVGWLEAAHPTVAGAPAGADRPSGVAPFGERALVFGDAHPLFGVLTPADPSGAKAGKHPIVMASAGTLNRTGPHRTYVKMARRWAKLGFDVLRMDLSGIGDSPVAPGAVENVTYPPSGVEDIGMAFRALGADRSIVLGLCSGGDYAFQLGAEVPKVAGAWMLNPRTFCVLDLAAVESGAPPTTSVDEVPRRLGGMAERGVDTLLLVSRNDPGVAYVDKHAAKEMGALEGVTGFRRVDLDGADHALTPAGIQDVVSDLLTEHLTSRH
jgi:alpha-beta hydrolase superfamily lysophospholipase